MMQNEKRLRVLFLPAWYPSEVSRVAGVFIREHAKAASLYNDIVVLYVYGDPSPQPRGLYRVSEEVEDGIRTIRVKYGGVLGYLKRLLFRNKKEVKHPIPLTSSNSPIKILKGLLGMSLIIVGDLLYYWSLFAAFRRLIKGGWKPDIIHAHVFTAGVPAVILGKLYKIPVVITEQTTNVATHSLDNYDRKRLCFAMSRAKVILPVSDDLRRGIENYYGVKNKFCVVPNVVNTRVFYPLTCRTEKEKHHKKRMLLVAVLTPRKGVPDLLEALSQIKNKRHDFFLDIVGDGPNRNEYEEISRELGFEDVVKFHGQQPEIVSFMRNCDFFVLPSLYENFGVVYIEAMACGKPVIATSAGGPSEIVNQKVGILVPPKDVKSLREAIEYMLDNYQNYSTEEIAQYAKKTFSYEAVGKMLDEVYKKVAYISKKGRGI